MRFSSDEATAEDASAPMDQPIATVFARDCTSHATLEDVAGTWGILALLALGESDHRFNALRRRVEGVSEKMLSQTLQTSSATAWSCVTSAPPSRPGVEYSLTTLGAEVDTASVAWPTCWRTRWTRCSRPARSSTVGGSPLRWDRSGAQRIPAVDLPGW